MGQQSRPREPHPSHLRPPLPGPAEAANVVPLHRAA